MSLTASELRARPSLRVGRGPWLIAPWIAAASLGCAIVLIPWTDLLVATLPRDYAAYHWAIAWGGFDIGLGIALAGTAVMVLRRSPDAEVTATITGRSWCATLGSTCSPRAAHGDGAEHGSSDADRHLARD